jgi:hypothetical protein
MKWEYKYHTSRLYEKELNSLGLEGWELVCFTLLPGPYYDYIFKRPIKISNEEIIKEIERFDFPK